MAKSMTEMVWSSTLNILVSLVKKAKFIVWKNNKWESITLGWKCYVYYKCSLQAEIWFTYDEVAWAPQKNYTTIITC